MAKWDTLLGLLKRGSGSHESWVWREDCSGAWGIKFDVTNSSCTASFEIYHDSQLGALAPAGLLPQPREAGSVPSGTAVSVHWHDTRPGVLCLQAELEPPWSRNAWLRDWDGNRAGETGQDCTDDDRHPEEDSEDEKESADSDDARWIRVDHTCGLDTDRVREIFPCSDVAGLLVAYLGTLADWHELCPFMTWNDGPELMSYSHRSDDFLPCVHKIE